MKPLILAAVLLSATAFLFGCATSPIPKDYTGPRATINDTLNQVGQGEIQVFEVTHVNGRMIASSSAATFRANQGMGMGYVCTKKLGREVPAQPLTLRISGHNQFASDAQAIFAHNYSVSGDVQFTPKPGAVYSVGGSLGKSGCAVWIEDPVTGRRVSNLIQK